MPGRSTRAFSLTRPTPSSAGAQRTRTGRRVSKALALLVAIVVPVAITELLPTTAHATGPDTVQFTQSSGSSKAYFKYVPGDGSTATTQNVTGGGGCSSPRLGAAQTGKTQGSTAPILGWAGQAWLSQTDYTPGGSSGAVVGAYNGSTGVCATGQNFSIDNVSQPSGGNSKWGLEELDFAAGSNPVDAGRPFTRATVNIINDTSTATTVHMIETLDGTQVASQDCLLAATTKSNSPSVVAADTTPNGTTCVGTDASFTAFDELKIQVPIAGESVSITQTSTFTLGGGKICGGQTVTGSDQSGSSGGVSATLTLNAPGTDCKVYANFAVSANRPDPNLPGDPKVVVFSGTGQSLPAGDHITTTVDWGYQPACAPATCAPTLISFDGGQTYVPQTFCAAADPANTTTPWCTTTKKFSYVDVNGTTMTHVVESWDGVGDPALRNP